MEPAGKMDAADFDLFHLAHSLQFFLRSDAALLERLLNPLDLVYMDQFLTFIELSSRHMLVLHVGVNWRAATCFCYLLWTGTFFEFHY